MAVLCTLNTSVGCRRTDSSAYQYFHLTQSNPYASVHLLPLHQYELYEVYLSTSVSFRRKAPILQLEWPLITESQKKGLRCAITVLAVPSNGGFWILTPAQARQSHLHHLTYLQLISLTRHHRDVSRRYQMKETGASRNSTMILLASQRALQGTRLLEPHHPVYRVLLAASHTASCVPGYVLCASILAFRNSKRKHRL